jgi:hypothetical protein
VGQSWAVAGACRDEQQSHWGSDNKVLGPLAEAVDVDSPAGAQGAQGATAPWAGDEPWADADNSGSWLRLALDQGPRPLARAGLQCGSRPTRERFSSPTLVETTGRIGWIGGGRRGRMDFVGKGREV